MSGRGMSGAALAQVDALSNRPLHLVEMYLASGTLYITDAYRPIEWGANTYQATGHFLSFSGIEETADIQVSQATLALSGIDQAYIAVALGQTYIDRRITIRKAFLHPSTEAVIVDPCLIFDGRMDAFSVEEDPDSGQCTVSVSAASHWVDFERRPGRHTNHAEQQLYYPGDLGFEYASENNEAVWGG